MKLLDAYNRRLEELACHDASCAPPPVGTGGSSTVGKIRSVLTDDLRRAPWKGCENPMAGHCYTASEALYHAMGGKAAGLTPMQINHEGAPHWFLKTKDGGIIDPTADQFKTPVPYEKAKGKGFLTRQPSKRARTILERAGLLPPIVSALARYEEELACHDKSCAPPPIGTGGSKPGKGSGVIPLPNGADPGLRRGDVLDYYRENWDSAEYKAAVKAATAYGEYLKEQIDSGNMTPRIRVPYDLAEQILVKDKRFKTQHESGSSNGAFDPDHRDGIEELMYGVPESRPVYGYMGVTGQDNGYINGYGEISVVLKEEMYDRIAIVFDDSLRDEAAAPVTISEIRNLSGDELGEALIAATSPAYSQSYQVTRSFEVAKAEPGKAPWVYTEAHMHGPVTKEDVREIIVNTMYDGTRPQEVNQALRGAGYTVVEHKGERMSDMTFTLQAALERHIEELACHDASCAPPPIGTGGSKPGGGGLPNGADVKPQREKLIAFVKEEWGYRYPSTLKAATAYGEHLKGMLEDGWEPRARISAGMAQQILIDDGELRTQHVTGNTGGGFNPDFRDEVEAEMFSAELTRPIYGYLGKDFEDTGAVWQYGDVSVVLTPETADRTTLTFGDSLGVRPAPIRITEIRELEGDELGEAVLGAYARNMLDLSSATSVRETFEMATRGGRSMPWRYIEAQIHGGVTRDDIKSVVIDAEGARRDKAFIEDLAYVLQDAGYSARIVPTDQSFTLLAALQRREEELACHDASCAPPPVGTGGSKPGKRWTGLSPSPQNRAGAPSPRITSFVIGPENRDDLADLGFDGNGDLARALYENDLGSDEHGRSFSSRVTQVRVTNNGLAGSRLEVDGDIMVDDGQRTYSAGVFKRYLYATKDGNGKTTLVAEHDYLKVDEDFHGLGIADAFNSHAVEMYQFIGVDRISVQASLRVGPYAWARQGFRIDPEIQVDWVDRRVKAVRKLMDDGVKEGRWSQEDADEVKKTATALNNAVKKGEDVQPIHIASLGEGKVTWEEDGMTMWPGKRSLINRTYGEGAVSYDPYGQQSGWYGNYYFDRKNPVAVASAVDLEHVAYRGTFGASASLTEALQRRLGFIQMIENYQDEPEEFGYNPNQPRDKEGQWVKIGGQWVKIDFP